MIYHTMQSKLKIAFVIISLAATVITLYAANQQSSGQSTIGGVDVSHLSPQMLSITPKVTRAGKGTSIRLDSIRAVDSLQTETTNH
ncbi:MAG: hypothetical protein JNM22_08670 [Saprospiraceae bacterium]|nr:hypothetical protein [Saprospiraceae bacterium]